MHQMMLERFNKRTEAKNLIKKYDPERPHALDYYLKITGYKENEIEKKL